MNKIFVSFLFMHLLSSAYAQTASKEQQAVQQTVKSMFHALGAADTSSLRQNTTSTVRFYEYGEAWNFDKIVSIVLQSKTTPDFKRADSFEFVSTNIKSNAAWVTYYLQSVISRNGREDTYRWMETVILVKEKDKWKIDVLHSTRLDKK